MFRGRKRRLPSFFVPEPFFHGSDSDSEPVSIRNRRRPTVEQELEVQQHRHNNVPQQNQQLLAQSSQDNLQVQEQQERDQVQQREQQLQDQVQQREQQIRDQVQQQEHQIRDQLQREQQLRNQVQQREQQLRDQIQGDQQLRAHLQREQEENNDHQHPDEPLAEPNTDSEDDWIDYDEDEGEDEDEDKDEDEDEDEEEGPHDIEQETDYFSILHSLSKKWSVAEMDHTISQSASNELWKIAFKFIPKLLDAKREQNVTRKVPQFNHLRRQLNNKYTPEVKSEMAFLKRDNEEVTVVNGASAPRSRFPGNEYEKLYEVSTVKVITTNSIGVYSRPGV